MLEQNNLRAGICYSRGCGKRSKTWCLPNITGCPYSPHRIAVLDERIEETAAAHPDFFIFKSLPGAGPALAFGSQRERYRNASEVQTYSGIAPVMEKSGKKQWIHFRWACPKFLRQSFHEWAGHSIGYSVWARAHCRQQRGKDVDHHGAVRALAFKWIRIVFRCWIPPGPADRQCPKDQICRAKLSMAARALGSSFIFKLIVCQVRVPSLGWSPNTRSRSRSSTASRLVLTECSETSSRCETRLDLGNAVN